MFISSVCRQAGRPLALRVGSVVMHCRGAWRTPPIRYAPLAAAIDGEGEQMPSGGEWMPCATLGRDISHGRRRGPVEAAWRIQRRRRFSFAKCCCSCWSTWKMTDCSVEATRPSTFCVLAATAPRLSSERKTELKSITKINSECMRQTLARIYRYSLTYKAILDRICNCCQRLHDFFSILASQSWNRYSYGQIFGKFHV